MNPPVTLRRVPKMFGIGRRWALPTNVAVGSTISFLIIGQGKTRNSRTCKRTVDRLLEAQGYSGNDLRGFQTFMFHGYH